MHTLDYQRQPPASGRATTSAVVLSGFLILEIALTLALLRYPNGQGGSFVAPELGWGFLLSLIAAIYGIFQARRLLFRNRKILAAVLIFLFAIAPMFLCIRGYVAVDYIRHFNFGPG
jgi:hypothetical protein